MCGWRGRRGLFGRGITGCPGAKDIAHDDLCERTDKLPAALRKLSGARARTDALDDVAIRIAVVVGGSHRGSRRTALGAGCRHREVAASHHNAPGARSWMLRRRQRPPPHGVCCSPRHERAQISASRSHQASCSLATGALRSAVGAGAPSGTRGFALPFCGSRGSSTCIRSSPLSIFAVAV